MRYASVVERLAALGGAKWGIHARARELAAAGRDVIELTIGEPDVPAPEPLLRAAEEALRAGRTRYSDGRGEPGLLDALAERYTTRAGRRIGTGQILCFPGTQTALYAVMAAIAETGCEVLVGDPMYATYEGVIRASGARPVAVPLRAEAGFRIRAEDIAARVTKATRAILLNTPHNPTGAVLGARDIAAIAEISRAHDLWVVSDEVYEELVFDGTEFAPVLGCPELADRAVAVSSISKSHAAPGFRSGWCVGPGDFARRLLPLSETMLFGNQPFIADMTERALREGSTVVAGMRRRFAARARMLGGALEGSGLRLHMPRAGMFAMMDVSGLGLGGEEYAHDLLERHGVAVMPGTAFGKTMAGWVRVALTARDADFARATERILNHAAEIGTGRRRA